MKLLLAIVYIFAIFALLTIGSLFIIVSLEVLAMEDALIKVQGIYQNPWQSFQLGFSGIVLIIMGLVFSKILVKQSRSKSDVVLLGKWGYVSVSPKTIEEVVRRGLKRFKEISAAQVKAEVTGNQLRVKLDMKISSEWNLEEVAKTVQDDLYQKISRLLGEGIDLEMSVKVNEFVDAPEPVGLSA